jgi:hypothetical protein
MPARPVDRRQRPWNKGLLIGQKKPLEPKHVWSIRVRLEIARSRRDGPMQASATVEWHAPLRLHHYAGWIGQYYCRNVKVRTTLAKISGRYATTSLSRLSGADILKPF